MVITLSRSGLLLRSYYDRAIGTLVVAYILKVPGLHFIGGLLLLWLTYKFISDEGSHSEVKTGDTLWDAIRTIIIADAARGLINNVWQ